MVTRSNAAKLDVERCHAQLGVRAENRWAEALREFAARGKIPGRKGYYTLF